MELSQAIEIVQDLTIDVGEETSQALYLLIQCAKERLGQDKALLDLQNEALTDALVRGGRKSISRRLALDGRIGERSDAA